MLYKYNFVFKDQKNYNKETNSSDCNQTFHFLSSVFVVQSSAQGLYMPGNCSPLSYTPKPYPSEFLEATLFWNLF